VAEFLRLDRAQDLLAHIPAMFVSLHNHGEQTPSFAHLCSMLANQAFLFAIVIGLIGLAFVF